jgi:hypothetical protein
VKRLAALALFLAIAGGCVGLRSPDDCSLILRDAPRMECYHQAAVTAAHMKNKDLAEQTCERIWLDFLNRPKDVIQRAELEANNCFYDVAKALPNPATCRFISKRTPDIGSTLGGESTTQSMCVQQATRLAQLEPDNYFRSNPNNLCSALFILPLVLAGCLLSRAPSGRKN